MATYLVTGAAGFIGSHLATKLVGLGHRVVGLDSLNSYYDVRLKQHRLVRLKESKGFRFLHIDLEDRGALDEELEDETVDGVINLAARAGVAYSMENPWVYFSTNATGTLNLLDFMVRRRIGKLVLASTSSLYAGQKMPFVETLPVNTPISPYAASKKAAEVLAYTYHHLYKVDVSVVRYFTVFGPSGRPDMSIFRMIQWIENGLPIQLLGTGEQSRDFTYVSDVADATVKAIRPVGYEVFNIGGGKEPVTLNWVIDALEKRLGKKAKIERHPKHESDMSATQADVSKAKKVLDWKPSVSLEQGLDKTVEWHLENREWLKTIEL